jgi:hypothetical protein
MAALMRPDLFGCAVLQVGVFDLLRFNQYTIGFCWIPEYGDPNDPTEFEWLRRYSPYHKGGFQDLWDGFIGFYLVLFSFIYLDAPISPKTIGNSNDGSHRNDKCYCIYSHCHIVILLYSHCYIVILSYCQRTGKLQWTIVLPVSCDSRLSVVLVVCCSL